MPQLLYTRPPLAGNFFREGYTLTLTLSDCLGILFLLMIVQIIGTHLQVRQYRKSVRKLHKLGNLGVGSNRRRLGGGSVVIIACKSDGTITGGEEMKGFTIFSGFKEIPNIVGKNIYDLKAQYSALPEKEQRNFKAYLQALEALEIRLNSEAEKSAEKSDA